MSTGGNDVDLGFRSEDRQVLDSLDKIAARMEVLERKTKSVNDAATKGQRAFAAGAKDSFSAVQLLEGGMASLGATIAGVFALDRVNAFMEKLDELGRKTMELAKKIQGGISGALASTGDASRRAEVEERLRGMASPLPMEQRLGLFKAISEEAPGAPLESRLAMTEKAAGALSIAYGGRQGFVGTESVARLAADIFEKGGISEGDALDLANVLTKENGGQDPSAFVEFAERYAATGRTLDERDDLRKEAYALATTAVRGGQSPEFLKSALGRAVPYSTKISGPDGREAEVVTWDGLRPFEILRKGLAGELPEDQARKLFGEGLPAARTFQPTVFQSTLGRITDSPGDAERGAAFVMQSDQAPAIIEEMRDAGTVINQTQSPEVRAKARLRDLQGREVFLLSEHGASLFSQGLAEWGAGIVPKEGVLVNGAPLEGPGGKPYLMPPQPTGYLDSIALPIIEASRLLGRATGLNGLVGASDQYIEARTQPAEVNVNIQITAPEGVRAQEVY